MPLTRRLILQKARHHPTKRALTDCKHTVSGTISLPSRGTFHHSLTVLIRYRSQQVFRLTGWSRQIHSRFHEPAATRGNAINPTHHAFTYRTLTSYGRAFQPTSANTAYKDTSLTELIQSRPTTPRTQPLSGITRTQFSQ